MFVLFGRIVGRFGVTSFNTVRRNYSKVLQGGESEAGG